MSRKSIHTYTCKTLAEVEYEEIRESNLKLESPISFLPLTHLPNNGDVFRLSKASTTKNVQKRMWEVIHAVVALYAKFEIPTAPRVTLQREYEQFIKRRPTILSNKGSLADLYQELFKASHCKCYLGKICENIQSEYHEKTRAFLEDQHDVNKRQMSPLAYYTSKCAFHPVVDDTLQLVSSVVPPAPNPQALPHHQSSPIRVQEDKSATPVSSSGEPANLPPRKRYNVHRMTKFCEAVDRCAIS